MNSDSIKIENRVKYIVYPKNKIDLNTDIGDTISGHGKFQSFKGKRNPGDYDFKKYYHIKQISGRVYSNNDLNITKNNSLVISKTIKSFRESVRKKTNRLL